MMPHPKAFTADSSPLPAPLSQRSFWSMLKSGFGSSPASLIATVLMLSVFIWWFPAVFRWAVTESVLHSANGAECKAASGACWAVIGEKYRVIMFGTFPYEEHWRPASVIALLTATFVFSAIPRFWSIWLMPLWGVAIGAGVTLMGGGLFGLSSQSTHNWGGLPLTLILFIGTVAGGLPTAIVLALGRQSRLPVIRLLCTLFIEITRGIPLIVVLFVASLIFPLFLPESMTIDKLARAQVGMILFFGAYAAEVIRGGLQAIPRGQIEAADSIGLGYIRRTQIVVLPQAIRIVAPALMNDIVRAFKNTTFVAILGLFDMLGATKAALEDVEWVRFAPETYLFIFLIYFVVCSAMSEYAKWLERRKDREQHS